jgi:hypothetical protein
MYGSPKSQRNPKNREATPPAFKKQEGFDMM